MAKKKPKEIPQEPSKELEKVQEEATNRPVEIKKVDALAAVEGFDPRKNLRTVCSGVWRYLCEDINNVKDEDFRGKLAQEFGIKTNDMIYLLAKQKYRIVVV